ncbi:hypothetical protein SAMN04489761_1594 [Tenacibaculum sp. MAR_2009_124]|uniref:aminopeptidase n=1 Tax=Tenacibaculum sp. MAR_2009_124 TaxID=1250059 RepID=UPI00089CB84F|nr:aminopeptidase [Tenacibaculum sp. MAR_2009_124]SEB73138.1 hypothetical protein SAMN04489761_1594 [Tenacibaculum sp. MAR_2009_124]
MINRFLLFLSLVLFVSIHSLFAQTNTISSNIILNDSSRTFKIQQRIVFINKSTHNLSKIYLHNWANSFSGNDTPLGKRLIEDYRKDFYFSEENERGFSKIKNLTVNYQLVKFQELPNQQDILELTLNKALNPKDSITISVLYSLKAPNSKFTGYGKTKSGYHLRFWQITPAVYDTKWNLMSNLNMDDLYQDVADYDIKIKVPNTYKIESNLYQYKTTEENFTTYQLVGNQKKDIILNIDSNPRFKSFKTKTQEIKTDAFDKHISIEESEKIITKQIRFIEKHIGKHPHTEIFVDRISVKKNSLQELYGLPRWMKPFPENFRWDVNFFYALSSKYINDILIHNKRKDYWFINGLETFLMMEYLKEYYPDVTILGKYSKYWPIKNYNLSKLKQSDKFPFIYQFSARKFYDQPLKTTADSLSNFNRKIVSKYKSGLGFRYLQDYLNDSILQKSIKKFLYKNHLKLSSPSDFLSILKKNTSKDIDWFAKDYLKTAKKIDYKITSIKEIEGKDSLKITIKNKRNFTAPVALYGINKKEIKFKKWISDIDSKKTIKVKKGDYTKLALNYENTYPEHNSLNNFRKTNNKLINKPLQFRFFQDAEDPYYNQLFYYPNIKYNLYDGISLGVKLKNQPIIPHNFEFTLTPNYSTKSRNFTGAFAVAYNQFFETSSIYKIKYGINGSNFHYAPELGYNTLVPYVSIAFRRKTLRDVGSKTLTTRLFYINKEVPQASPITEQDRYKVLNFRYIYSKPNIIERLQYAVNFELGNNFTKLSTDIRYLKFFDNERSFDLRFFGGMFVTNNSVGDYFSFGLNRSSDYLFEQNLFGRSESSGLFSQQFIISDAGFKSKYNTPQTANQFILAGNTSVSVWKWAEIYNDFAMLKNKSSSPNFYYENGIRLNFVPNIFEFYFPIYSNQGWEVTKHAYPSKIRFVITTNLDRIYNFIRRGIL